MPSLPARGHILLGSDKDSLPARASCELTPPHVR